MVASDEPATCSIVASLKPGEVQVVSAPPGLAAVSCCANPYLLCAPHFHELPLDKHCPAVSVPQRYVQHVSGEFASSTVRGVLCIYRNRLLPETFCSPNLMGCIRG